MNSSASVLESREMLYFIYGRGCAACEAASPEFDAFAAKHPGIMALRIDAAGPHPARLGLKVKVTPTYFYRRGQEGIAWERGALDAKGIEAWLKKIGVEG